MRMPAYIRRCKHISYMWSSQSTSDQLQDLDSTNEEEQKEKKRGKKEISDMVRWQGGKEARDGIEKENRERTRRQKKKKNQLQNFVRSFPHLIEPSRLRAGVKVSGDPYRW